MRPSHFYLLAMSGKGHAVSALFPFGMGHLKPFAKFLQGFAPGPCGWALLQNCLAVVGILDTVVPHGLQACPSSQVAPLETPLQPCEASQQLGWTVMLQQMLLLGTRSGGAIHAGCGKPREPPALLKPALGAHTRVSSLPFGGREKTNLNSHTRACPVVGRSSL